MTGATYLNNCCIVTVWAPLKKSMALQIVNRKEQTLEMQKDEWGYFSIKVQDMLPGSRYFFIPDGENSYPDPASQYQPEGVHGPSEVLNHKTYQWQDNQWSGIPFKDLILYELHIGTFTPAGTFDAAIAQLDNLVATGINAIEIMPIAQYPGNRNWGYDGVFPYAVQNSYGGPDGLKKLVDACHQKGVAVFLDVVYNHLGPEGNYLNQFGPYFNDKYHTPWGNAINFDNEWSDGVREYFLNNAIYWFEIFHIDGLRLDAIHAIFDSGAVHFWEQLHERIKLLEQKTGRIYYTIAESDLNNPRVVKGAEVGGYGFDAQWLDDFHHALYVLLNKKNKEHFPDFGTIEQLAKAYKDGFVHSGEYTKLRKRKYGASSAGISGQKFVVFNQNHDQVGNSIGGERLSVLIDFERLKLAAAAILISPYIPMLFMGEEYAEDQPFAYFISHTDEALVKAVQEGRKKEFERLQQGPEPEDPQAEATFNKSKLQWQKRTIGKHAVMLNWYKKLIQMRKTIGALQHFKKDEVWVNIIDENALVVQRQSEDGGQAVLCLFNFGDGASTYILPSYRKQWRLILNSKEKQWLEEDEESYSMQQKINAGESISLSPCSVVVYEHNLY